MACQPLPIFFWVAGSGGALRLRKAIQPTLDLLALDDRTAVVFVRLDFASLQHAEKRAVADAKVCLEDLWGVEGLKRHTRLLVAVLPPHFLRLAFEVPFGFMRWLKQP
jgi:hypothetical protein